jgi:hypothetical protein
VEAPELQANILAAYVAGHLAAQLPSIISQLRINPRASFEVRAAALQQQPACVLVAPLVPRVPGAGAGQGVAADLGVAAPQVAYNRACGLLQLGDLAAAESELRTAIKIGGCLPSTPLRCTGCICAHPRARQRHAPKLASPAHLPLGSCIAPVLFPGIARPRPETSRTPLLPLPPPAPPGREALFEEDFGEDEVEEELAPLTAQLAYVAVRGRRGLGVPCSACVGLRSAACCPSVGAPAAGSRRHCRRAAPQGLS